MCTDGSANMRQALATIIDNMKLLLNQDKIRILGEFIHSQANNC